MDQSTLTILGCCRDVSEHLSNVLKNITAIGECFKDYSCVFIESDSNDKTLELLRNFAKGRKVEVLSLGNLSRYVGSRTARLEICRNLALECARNKKTDYTLVIDMDNVGKALTDLEGVKSNFKYDDWDVITASNETYYYDIWALRCPGIMDYDCWIEQRAEMARGKSWEEAAGMHIGRWGREFARSLDAPLVPVRSAFNGAAFYRMSSLLDSDRYVGTHPDGTEQCEHVGLHDSIYKRGGKIYINPRFIIHCH